MLLPSPIIMRSVSPRSTQPNHTLAPAPRLTLPITSAESAIQAAGSTCGATPSNSYTAIAGLLRSLLRET